jgi:hypothetical protein
MLKVSPTCSSPKRDQRRGAPGRAGDRPARRAFRNSEICPRDVRADMKAGQAGWLTRGDRPVSASVTAASRKARLHR